MNHQPNFDDGSYSHSSYNTPHSLPLRPSRSIESIHNLSSDELRRSSSLRRSPSHASLMSSRQASPAMDSRPTRKQTAPGALDLDIPITYTPTTHRISKAKKGKKVHVCEFGCGKVFTRAEHRKRHEANHKPDPLFKCHIEGCQKPFQRRDLLDRHLERQHGITTGTRRRASSAASSAAGSNRGSPVPTIAYSQPSGSPAMMGYSDPNTPAMMANPHMVPSRGRAYSQPLGSFNEPFDMPLSETSRSFTPDFVSEPEPMYGPAGFYTSDMRGSGGQQFNQAYQKPTTMYAADNYSMPMGASYPAYGQPVEGLGLDLSGGQFPSHVGYGSTTYAALEPGSGSHGSAPPGPYANELPPSHVVVDDVDEETRSHYEICYWETVDPIFPIIHYGTYINSARHPGLRDAVCALGAQASPRPMARKHSVALYDGAMIQCQSTVPESPSALETPLEMLQLTFLLEYLSLFRLRTPGVYNSPRFAALFNNLLSDHQGLQDPEEFYSSAAIDGRSVHLGHYHQQWIDLETRRRILAGCLVLDTHRSKLFEQRVVSHAPSTTVEAFAFPCSAGLWTADFQRWHALSRDPASAQQPTYFHSSLQHSISLERNGTIALHIPPDMLACALQLATHTPVRPLLVTAAGSWLFTRKVSEANWAMAKAELRAWAAGQDATIAAWLAGKVLREYFSPVPASAGHPRHLQSRPGIIRLETHWVLYLAALVLWAYTSPASRSPSVAPSAPLSAPYSQMEHQEALILQGGAAGSAQRRTQSHPAHLHPLAHFRAGGMSPPPGMILHSQPAVLSPGMPSPHYQSSPPLGPPPTSDPSSSSQGPPPPGSSTPALARRGGAPSSGKKGKGQSQATTDRQLLAAFLARLDTGGWQEVVQVRGAGGAVPVLAAVRVALAEASVAAEPETEVAAGKRPAGGEHHRKGIMHGQDLVLEVGCAVAEAVGVLARLEGGRAGVF